jgi:hypothetical protein
MGEFISILRADCSGGAEGASGVGFHLNHPRLRKYHIGTMALATISVSANG